MDDTFPSVDVAALHEAIKTAIIAAFPAPVVATVDYYSRPGIEVPLPGIFFELDGIDPDGSSSHLGTGQWSCVLRFSAYVIATYKLGGKLQARTLATALAAIINQNNFGQSVGIADVHGIVEDAFHQDNHEYSVMRVDWLHKAIVGTVVPDTTPIPSGVFLGIAPLIGPANVEDYIEIV